MSRRGSVCLVVALAAIAVATVPASAAPAVSFKAKLVPVPGYPETGNLYGGGAAVQLEYLISGDEYEQSPPPLAAIDLQLPKGFRVNLEDWPSCSTSPLEPEAGGSGFWYYHCRPPTHAGPAGTVEAFVSLGAQRELELATIESVRTPSGELHFGVDGHSPVSVEIFAVGHWAHLLGGAGFGPELATEIPLVESLPGAPFVSIGGIHVQLGAGRGPKPPGKASYYVVVPKKGECPRRGFQFRTEVTFAAAAALPGQRVTDTYRAPCPRRSAG